MTIKLEDAINRIAKEIKKGNKAPTSYFSSSLQFNLHIEIKSSQYAKTTNRS